MIHSPSMVIFIFEHLIFVHSKCTSNVKVTHTLTANISEMVTYILEHLQSNGAVNTEVHRILDSIPLAPQLLWNYSFHWYICFFQQIYRSDLKLREQFNGFVFIRESNSNVACWQVFFRHDVNYLFVILSFAFSFRFYSISLTFISQVRFL